MSEQRQDNHFKDWSFQHWAYLHGKPQVDAIFKQQPEDFVVTEKLGFDLTGEGENLFLLIEKKGLNTQQVCEHLAKFFSRRLRDIGYAGLKDKQSISRQWFSVQMNLKQEIDLQGLETDNIRLIDSTRHIRKLKVGALAANHFDIMLKDVSDMTALQQRLELIKQTCVPNYFGEQRFGFKGNNLNWANRMASGEAIRDKKIKGFGLSAARSYLFNEVVSKRIEQGYFEQSLNGDVYLLAGSNSYFSQAIDDEITSRLASGDIQISAPLYGDGDMISKEQARRTENSVLGQYPQWLELLTAHGLEQERRAIKLVPRNISWQVQGDNLLLSFDLASGCFATSVLRECINIIQE